MRMMTIDPADFDAAVFDLDGVLTDTARIHAAAWKQVFDSVLDRHGIEGTNGRPFDPESDYLHHVDGRPRSDGVRAFLASRGLGLPEGSDDDRSLDTIAGVGNAKNEIVAQRLRTDSRLEPGALELVAAMKAVGMKVAVASSSANCAAVLEAVGLAGMIDARVDGVDLRRLGLPGKPDPAMFLEALRRIDAAADRAIVFEDAEAGVEAGRRARFRRVVGIADGSDRTAALLRCGADVAVAGLSHVRLGDAQRSDR